MKRTVYKGSFVRVEEEEIGAGKVLFEKAYLRNGCTVIPFNSAGRLVLVREHRPQEEPALRLKLVTGFLEEGYSVEENANRELMEEAGLKAGRLQAYAVNRQTGSFNQTNHFVLAAELEPVKVPNPDGEESILEVLSMPLAGVYEMLLDGSYGISASSYILMRICLEIREGRFGFIPGLKF